MATPSDGRVGGPVPGSVQRPIFDHGALTSAALHIHGFPVQASLSGRGRPRAGLPTGMLVTLPCSLFEQTDTAQHPLVIAPSSAALNVLLTLPGELRPAQHFCVSMWPQMAGRERVDLTTALGLGPWFDASPNGMEARPGTFWAAPYTAAASSNAAPVAGAYDFVWYSELTKLGPARRPWPPGLGHRKRVDAATQAPRPASAEPSTSRDISDSDLGPARSVSSAGSARKQGGIDRLKQDKTLLPPPWPGPPPRAPEFAAFMQDRDTQWPPSRQAEQAEHEAFMAREQIAWPPQANVLLKVLKYLWLLYLAVGLPGPSSFSRAIETIAKMNRRFEILWDLSNYDRADIALAGLTQSTGETMKALEDLREHPFAQTRAAVDALQGNIRMVARYLARYSRAASPLDDELYRALVAVAEMPQVQAAAVANDVRDPPEVAQEQEHEILDLDAVGEYKALYNFSRRNRESRFDEPSDLLMQSATARPADSDQADDDPSVRTVTILLVFPRAVAGTGPSPFPGPGIVHSMRMPPESARLAPLASTADLRDPGNARPGVANDMPARVLEYAQVLAAADSVRPITTSSRASETAVAMLRHAALLGGVDARDDVQRRLAGLGFSAAAAGAPAAAAARLAAARQIDIAQIQDRGRRLAREWVTCYIWDLRLGPARSFVWLNVTQLVQNTLYYAYMRKYRHHLQHAPGMGAPVLGIPDAPPAPHSREEAESSEDEPDRAVRRRRLAG